MNSKTDKNIKAKCKYGNKCYRKNEAHLQEFAHSGDDEDGDEQTSLNSSLPIDEDDAAASDDKDVFSKTFEIKPDTENLENIEKIDLDQVKDVKELISEHYQMQMPDDFYEFLEFCKSIDPKDPKRILEKSHLFSF
jgi:hypothetical protein